jgi:hypothetical protein
MSNLLLTTTMFLQKIRDIFGPYSCVDIDVTFFWKKRFSSRYSLTSGPRNKMAVNIKELITDKGDELRLKPR